ncbi:TolC family protein [Inhella gelatinilytica]|uniref:TolC family protein n=1 Tax=Inhella gelatinilytica TaxID=2795030 RepID=A0A931NDA7_9BURK|nr:TolC family protein [Inhella gelatinilytica]MBH9552887.1 TolC family protein [Inhella gelatinilytica]
MLRSLPLFKPALMVGALVLASAGVDSAPRTQRKQAQPLSAAAQAETPTPTVRCGDDDRLALKRDPVNGADLQFAQSDPRGYLVQLADLAVERSRLVGMAQLLSLAAQDELKEAEWASRPEASLSLSTVGASTGVSGGATHSRAEGRATLSVAGVLWDGGQRRQLIEWRKQLVEAAQAARQGQAEQIALQTVALSLDRSRYTLQLQIYRQYVRKMACLVESLDAITQFDKGRSSEWVQAQKQQQQAELALASTQDYLQSVETRLKRLVGDPLPPPGSLSAVLIRVPELAALQKDLLASPEVAQSTAQALAAQRQADALAAGQGPRLNWVLNGSAVAARGGNNSHDAAAGLQVTIPLYRPSDTPARDAARRRAEAVNLARDESLDAKNWRLMEVHDAASNSLDRARRIAELLRSSQQLRGATLQQWQQLGRRSLFDVMGAESDYYMLRIQQINALYDAQQAVALMGSMGRGVGALLR